MAVRYVAWVKKDCPTCELIEPVLAQLESTVELEVVTQDDPEFPSSISADHRHHDADLTRSWQNDVEVVPTLVALEGDVERERVVGWSRPAWQSLTGITSLAPELPEHRPGCGSLSVDPEHADRLAAHFAEDGHLTSRRVEFAELEDEFEAMYDRGWSDGLPIVPPTPERVQRMLSGTSRAPGDSIAVVPPSLVDLTVEKVAINAVMAGCRPEYLPVVIAALEAVCTDEFNMHGVIATTMGVGPVFIVNGPIRNAIGMNAGINALGHGNRANSTIGRAVQLIIRNVGGGRPGEIDRATHGTPAKLGFCFPEDEEGSPWTPLSVDRGFATGTDTITAFAGEGPRIIFDQLSRTPEALTASIAESLMACVSPRLVLGFDAVLVLCPEHMARYTDAAWSKRRFTDELFEHLMIDADSIGRGVGGIDEGMPPGFEGQRLPKFNPDGGLLIVHAGGTAGLFSSVIGGWVTGSGGSVPVTKEITR